MKNKLLRIVAAAALIGTAASCTTAYDAYGNPRQVVDPGAAALGAAAAGIAGYAIGRSNDDGHRHRHYRSGRSYRAPRHYYSRGYRGHGYYY